MQSRQWLAMLMQAWAEKWGELPRPVNSLLANGNNVRHSDREAFALVVVYLRFGAAQGDSRFARNGLAIRVEFNLGRKIEVGELRFRGREKANVFGILASLGRVPDDERVINPFAPRQRPHFAPLARFDGFANVLTIRELRPCRNEQLASLDYQGTARMFERGNLALDGNAHERAGMLLDFG